LGEVTNSGLHLNLGCGHFLLAGHTNIDAYAYEPGVTVLRFPPLPYDDAKALIRYISAIPRNTCRRGTCIPLLAECKRVLKSGGSLTVVVPDADKARLLAESGRLTLTWYALAVQGERNDLMPHFTIWNKVRVRQLLELAGFAIDEAYSWKDDPRVHDTSSDFSSRGTGDKAVSDEILRELLAALSHEQWSRGGWIISCQSQRSMMTEPQRFLLGRLNVGLTRQMSLRRTANGYRARKRQRPQRGR
jgi:hypothetical protein